MDGEHWTVVDNKQTNALRGRNTYVRYEIRPVKCRYIRLTQTSQNDRGRYDTYISAMDFRLGPLMFDGAQ